MQDYQLLTGKEVLSINVEDISSIMDRDRNMCRMSAVRSRGRECRRIQFSGKCSNLIFDNLLLSAPNMHGKYFREQYRQGTQQESQFTWQVATLYFRL